VKDDRLYERVAKGGSLGLGESYMDGWWECENMDDFFCRIMPCNPEEKLGKNLRLLFCILRSVVLNPARKSRSFQVGERHYDLGDNLYRNMLDKRMIYSCAYWKDAMNLDDAQEAKLDLICRKLSLRPGDRVLDIGCGWGGFAKYVAEKYGVEVVGITVSKKQVAHGRNLCEGLPVVIRLQDYRDLDEMFDHIISVGMFEHVGYKNYRKYMETVHRCLKDNGLFLLQTIGRCESRTVADPWFDRYISPNSFIPSMKQVCASAEDLFVVEDWHNFGDDYDKTLVAWFSNFNRNWDVLKSRYDDRFYRMWKYYLLSCAGSFRSRYLQVWRSSSPRKGLPEDTAQFDNIPVLASPRGETAESHHLSSAREPRG